MKCKEHWHIRPVTESRKKKKSEEFDLYRPVCITRLYRETFFIHNHIHNVSNETMDSRYVHAFDRLRSFATYAK